MTEPNEFGDRWCCEPCKRLAEAAADETLAAATLASQLSSPRHVVAMALHREHCGERPPEATHPADMDCHLIDADAALQALIAAGYTVLVKDPHATSDPGIAGGVRLTDVCPHCPDGHPDPLAKPWGVSVHPDRNGDGKPTYLMVAKADGSHLAESDAVWLWELIRAQSPPGTQAEADLKANPVPERQWRSLRTGRA